MKLKLFFCFFWLGLLTVQAQINSVGIVGSAVGGWPGTQGNPGPEDVHQMSSTDGINWVYENLTITNSSSQEGLKFRANNQWNINWGANSFPSGLGTQDGPNIIGLSGVYDVFFNSTTGAYSFVGGNPASGVKLIGTATGNTDGLIMTTDDGIIYKIENISLNTGTAQFEINGNVRGSEGFPEGSLSSPSQLIPVSAAQYTSVTLNIVSGAYTFDFAPITSSIFVTLSGSALAGTNNTLTMSSLNGVVHYYSNLSTTQGTVTLNINTSGVIESFGGDSFPSGVGILNGTSISIPSGTWNVTFNAITKTYIFSGTSGNPTISIVGSGVGGWPGQIGNPGPEDVHQLTTEDGINYSISELAVTAGEVKFRQGNDWSVNWGDTAFPTGIGTQGGSNIIIPDSGIYNVSFNRITGAYNFIQPDTIAIVGTGVGGWPSEGETDTYRLTSEDGINFRLNNLEVSDGVIRFRQNNSWDLFWGGNSLSGNLVLFGPAITTAAGTYNILLNKLTGNYSLSTMNPSLRLFQVYPNPSNTEWNFTSENQFIETIEIFDLTGKTIVNLNLKSNFVSINTMNMTKGMYVGKITSAIGTETVKLIKN